MSLGFSGLVSPTAVAVTTLSAMPAGRRRVRQLGWPFPEVGNISLRAAHLGCAGASYTVLHGPTQARLQRQAAFSQGF